MKSNIHNAGQRTLLLGMGPLARVLVREIEIRPQCPYHIIGMVAETGYAGLRDSPGHPLLGSMENLQQIIQATRPDRIIVSLSERRGHLPVHQLVEARVIRNILVEDGETVYEKLAGKLAIEALTPSGVIFSKEFQPRKSTLALTRFMSFVIAAIGIILLAPLLALISLLIKVDSRGPVLFVQERVGMSGKKFSLMKFRTMHPVQRRPSEWVGDNLHRITRVGKWLRKFRLDELPQFVNVLKGDMNVVGPRPHPASNFELFVLVSRNTPECGGQIPYYSLRSLVRPGITGWAQVRYRYANDLNEEIEKLRFDLYYVKHCSLRLDIRILLETIKVVVMGREFDADGADSDTNHEAVTPGRTAYTYTTTGDSHSGEQDVEAVQRSNVG